MEILTCCIISTRGEIFFLNNFEEESLRLTSCNVCRCQGPWEEWKECCGEDTAIRQLVMAPRRAVLMGEVI